MKRARLVQWLVFFFFFRQTTDLTVYVLIFTETTKATQAKSGQCKPSAKGPPFHFLPFLRNLQNRTRPKGLLGTVRNFFEKILMSQKSPPSSFLIFCNIMYVNNSQMVPPFHFSALCDIFRKRKVRSLFKESFFVASRGKSDFPVMSRMKGTLWVSRNCFQSFA